MFLRLIRANEDFSIMVGTKHAGAVAYVWYFKNDLDPLKPYALTDSYREFWL